MFKLFAKERYLDCFNALRPEYEFLLAEIRKVTTLSDEEFRDLDGPNPFPEDTTHEQMAFLLVKQFELC